MGTAPIPMPSSSSALHCSHETFDMIHTGPCLEACFLVPPFCCDASAFLSPQKLFTLFLYISHRCLEFEQKLLDVMELRKAAENIKETKSPANAGCIRRCHETFERACRKFKGDLALWMGWLQFCKATQSNRRMSKVILQSLQSL